jgi:hypothetical protein
MGDFLPGYVTTFCNPKLNEIDKKILIIGKESGKIYSSFDTKEELFERVRNRKNSTTMVCYYRNIEFNPEEREILWAYRMILFNEAEKKRVTDSLKTLIVRLPRRM